jgi:hydroxyacylglutathione hydrolase
MLLADDSPVLLDVRGVREFAESHVKGAVNIPAPELRTRHTELDRSRAIILTCSTGHRSSLAASILEQHGFTNIKNAAGGLKGYSAAAFAPACVMCSIPHGPQFVFTKEE